MPLFVDGVDIKSVYVDGQQIREVWVDGVKVWTLFDKTWDGVRSTVFNGNVGADTIINTTTFRAYLNPSGDVFGDPINFNDDGIIIPAVSTALPPQGNGVQFEGIYTPGVSHGFRLRPTSTNNPDQYAWSPVLAWNPDTGFENRRVGAGIKNGINPYYYLESDGGFRIRFGSLSPAAQVGAWMNLR